MFAAVLPAVAAGAAPAAASPFRSTAVLVAAGRGPAVLERMREAVGPAGTAAAAKQCYSDVSILSDANGQYVTVEVDYDALLENALRAVAPGPGPNELFYVCRNNVTGYTTLKSQANNLYVSAEFDYTGDYQGTLRARAGSVWSWEGYYTSADPGHGAFTMQIDNRYVTAELGLTGLRHAVLRAASPSAGRTETFRW
ncbi:fascin domain-containing protein [Actinoplanes teichomyceticus]|uniref:fascin domain-containing protein n=1 Tax=Actinoplanes teichomyceticus TaxID=1867 RepID=UPI0011A23E38|nr:hypothetical protein [Actinoplanes teichomyceticus]GIF15755.1 hypothetical protein Ate01nite_57870 [Actinoplanes teichomyceticus]